MPSTVIIGAGISGLQCASAFLRLGHTVTILEREEDVGGVWLRYTAFDVQVPREFFRFPDFACPPELEPEEYPNGRSLLRYIIAYAHKNQLYRHTIFRATVTRLHRFSGQWQCFFDLRTGGQGRATAPGVSHNSGIIGGGGGGELGGGGGGVVIQQQRITADFVVVSTGLHSSPNMPLFDGHHLFRGRLLHVQDLPPNTTDLSELVAGRRVLVVGATKTAVDTATRLAAVGAEETVVVYRQAHWPISRYPLRGIHFTRLLHSRLAASMLDPYYDAGLWARAKGWMTRPLRRLFWRTLERSLVRQQHLSGDLLPSLPLDKDLLSGGLVHDGKWLQCLQDGSVRAIRGEPLRFTSEGLILRSGEFVPTDLVVLATGHVKDYSFIDADILSKLGVQRDGLYLYRHVLPPRVRNIAFVGAANSLNNPLTSYLQAKWLVACLEQRVQLPEPHDMLRDLQRQTRWQRRKLPPQADRASMIGIYSHYYHDRLLKDMGLRTRRKRNLWRECFDPYTAADYADLTEGTGSEGRGRSGSAAPAAASSSSAHLQLAPAMSLAQNSSFKLSAEPSAATPSDLYDVTPVEHSVGFGFMPSMRRTTAAASQGSTTTDTAAAAAAAVAAAVGLNPDNEVGPTEAEGRWVSISGTAAHETPGLGQGSGSGPGQGAANQGPSTAPPALMPSSSYNSRSGAVLTSTRLLTLYEQEALNGGRGVVVLRSGPGLGRLGVGPNSSALTPPDTPPQLMSPVSYGAGFRSIGRPALYMPPSSGRSCLMDAAALAMMDGVIGGALLDKLPKSLSSTSAAATTATAAAAAGTTTATSATAAVAPGKATAMALGQQHKPQLASVTGDQVRLAAGPAATPSNGPTGNMAVAVAGQIVGGAPRDVGTADTAQASTTTTIAPVMGRMEPGVNGIGASGGAAAPGTAAAARATAEAEMDTEGGRKDLMSLQTPLRSSVEELAETSGSFDEDGDSSSGETAARVMPIDVMSSSSSGDEGGGGGGGGNSRRGAGGATLSLRGYPALFVTPALAAALVAAATKSDSEIQELQLEKASLSGGGGGDGGGGSETNCDGGRGTESTTSASASASPSLCGESGGRSITTADGVAAVRAGLATARRGPPLHSRSAAAQRRSSGRSGAADEAPLSSTDSNSVPHSRTRSSSPTHSSSNARLTHGSGGRLTPQPRSLVRLVTTRHATAAGGAAGGAVSTDSAGGSRPSSSGSVNAITAGAVRIGSSTVGMQRARRRTSDFFDESDDFVGTPPSCFEGSMEALVTVGRDRGRGSRSSRSRNTTTRQQRRSQGYTYNGDDSDDYDNDYDNFDEDEEYAYIPGGAGRLGSQSTKPQPPLSAPPPGQQKSARDGSADDGSCGRSLLTFPPAVTNVVELYGGGGTNDRRQGPSSEPVAWTMKDVEDESVGGDGNSGGIGGVGGVKGIQDKQVGAGDASMSHSGGARPYTSPFSLQPSASFGPSTTTTRSTSPNGTGGSYNTVTSSRLASAAAVVASAAAAGSSGSGSGGGGGGGNRFSNHFRQRESTRTRMSVDSAADTATRTREDGGGTSGGGSQARSQTTLTATGSGGGGGNSVSLALERYAARMTAAPTFRMSLTNMADMKPQNLKHAARAAAAAAAMAASMAAAGGSGGGGGSIHSAPLHSIFLQPGGSGIASGGGHLSYQTAALHPYHMATSRLAPLRPTRVTEETGMDGEVPPGVVMGAGSNDNGGGGASSWDGDDGGGTGSMSALMLVGGDDDCNAETAIGGSAIGAIQSSPSNPIVTVGRVGAGGSNPPRASTVMGYGGSVGGHVSSEGFGKGPLSVGPLPQGRGAAGSGGGGGGGGGVASPSPYSHHSATNAVHGTDGVMSASPPGGGLVGAGSWDMTFKQLSRAVVAPPQRTGLRAAMISRRNLISGDRPSESGLATPTGGSFFNTRRGTGDDPGGGSGGGGSGIGAALSAGAAGGSLSVASGSGSGSGLQLFGSGGGSGGVAAVAAAVAGLSSGSGPALLGAGVQPSGPAMAPVRELNASRFVAMQNNSSGKTSRLQAAPLPPDTTLTPAGSQPSPLLLSPGLSGLTAMATAAAAAESDATSSGGASHHHGGSTDDASAGGFCVLTATDGGGGANGSPSLDTGGDVSGGGGSSGGGSGTVRTRMHWAAAVAAARELRFQSESTRSAFAALVMAARARRSCTAVGVPGAPSSSSSSHQSPMLAKLIAASQSCNGLAQPDAGDRDARISRAAGGAGAAVAPTTSIATLAFQPSDIGAGYKTSCTVSAAEAARVQPMVVPGSSGGGGGGAGWRGFSVASSGGGRHASWEGGNAAISFKRLSSLLMPSSPPGTTHLITPKSPGTVTAEEGPMTTVDSVGGASRMPSCSSEGGSNMPGRRLRRMISSNRRSNEGGFPGPSITTVEEDSEVMGLPPPLPSAAAAAAAAGGGGGGSSSAGETVIVAPLESPSAELADALFGRTTSRRSVVLYNPAAMPLDLYTSPSRGPAAPPPS